MTELEKAHHDLIKAEGKFKLVHHILNGSLERPGAIGEMPVFAMEEAMEEALKILGQVGDVIDIQSTKHRHCEQKVILVSPPEDDRQEKLRLEVPEGRVAASVRKSYKKKGKRK